MLNSWYYKRVAWYSSPMVDRVARSVSTAFSLPCKCLVSRHHRNAGRRFLGEARGASSFSFSGSCLVWTWQSSSFSGPPNLKVECFLKVESKVGSAHCRLLCSSNYLGRTTSPPRTSKAPLISLRTSRRENRPFKAPLAGGNPRKYSYSPELCPNGVHCPRGLDCHMAHTQEARGESRPL